MICSFFEIVVGISILRLDAVAKALRIEPHFSSAAEKEKELLLGLGTQNYGSCHQKFS